MKTCSSMGGSAVSSSVGKERSGWKSFRSVMLNASSTLGVKEEDVYSFYVHKVEGSSGDHVS